MPRPILAASAAALLVVLIAGCTAGTTASPAPTSTPSGASTSEPGTTAGGPSPFPTCDEVTTALDGLLTGLSYDVDLSTAQTADEAYAQRVCVYTTSDATAQIGVSFAAIPFQQTELDSYATLPNAVADDRLAEHKSVLQTFQAGDGDDGHLDGALYLFDEQYSITVQGYAKDGSATTATLPQLTLAAATDAAFAARDLVQ